MNTVVMPELPPLLVDRMVRDALQEDLGRAGDITSQAIIPPDARARALIACRQDGVIAGLAFVESAFQAMDSRVCIEYEKTDGDSVSAGTVLCRISGNARAMLAAERVALNFLMHLSGIATLTAAYAAEIAHTRARVCCTRKTMPGLRVAEKYAVRCGGGTNHRFGLDDAVLIKDNHIAIAGGVAKAVRSARADVGHLVKVEVEVDTLDQLREALEAAPDAVLLDNMTPSQLAEAVAINAERAVLEASGNIDLTTIRAVAESGVDLISTSKITMAAATLDVGLDMEIG